MFPSGGARAFLHLADLAHVGFDLGGCVCVCARACAGGLNQPPSKLGDSNSPQNWTALARGGLTFGCAD